MTRRSFAVSLGALVLVAGCATLVAGCGAGDSARDLASGAAATLSRDSSASAYRDPSTACVFSLRAPAMMPYRP